MPATTDVAVLDNPTWVSLTGHHAPWAERRGRAARYPGDVCPFVAVTDGEAESWEDLAELVGPEGEAVLAAPPALPPAGWTLVWQGEGVQMDGTALRGEPDPTLTPLGPADVPEMLALIERTKPGPFLPRTVELGAYLGVHRDGVLVAMAGERLRPPGWTEISAVCTDPAWRGHGLATQLVRAVAAGIQARGDVPFLHAAATNAGAIRLYEQLGFTVRRPVTFALVRAPGAAR